MKIIKKEYKKILVIAVGSLIYAVGIVWFLNPSGVYSGGITGTAQLITNICDRFLGGSINLGLLIFLLNVPIVIFGFVKMTRKFIYYSLYSVLLQSLFIGLFPVNILLQNDLLSNALVGGILIGIGTGLNLRVGGSAGGVDIIFQYISFKRNITMGSLGMILNVFIISIAGFVFGWPIAIYTIIRVIITSLVIDKVHTSYNYIKIEVITEHGVEIADLLVSRTIHGVTISKGKGAYSHHEKDILHTIISSYELNKFIMLIRAIDKEAFISVSTVKKVVGNFTKIYID
ncbi:MAG: YitT family protein [Candidatus Izimaplasma sp.]|nr:YitT family protein [Candidatus Izimaplasma bacterium]